jgi:hypothetical protein
MYVAIFPPTQAYLADGVAGGGAELLSTARCALARIVCITNGSISAEYFCIFFIALIPTGDP